MKSNVSAWLMKNLAVVALLFLAMASMSYSVTTHVATDRVTADYLDGNQTWSHQVYPPCTSIGYAVTCLGDSITGTYFAMNGARYMEDIDGGGYSVFNLTNTTSDGVYTDTIGSKSGSGISWGDSQDMNGETLSNGTISPTDIISDIIHQTTTQHLVLSTNYNNASISGNDVFDSSIENNHCINHGATHNSTGGFNGGGAYDFDYSDDYIDCGSDSSLDLRNGFTVEIWFQTPDLNQNRGIVSRKTQAEWSANTGYSIQINSAGQIVAKVGDENTMSSLAFDDDSIHYLVVTWSNGSATRMFIDGSEVAYSLHENTTTIGISTSSLTVGRYYDDRLFNGVLDELKIHNVILTSDEILSNYRTYNKGVESSVLQRDMKVNDTGIYPQKDFYIEVNQKICWNTDCTAYETWNGTHKIEVYP